MGVAVMILLFDVGNTIDRCLERFDTCPFAAHAAYKMSGRKKLSIGKASRPTTALYTPEERERRNRSPWTLVQGILAPLQFLVFLVSLFFVVRYMVAGVGYEAATISIVVKTMVLYTIMVTGAIWEREVFGQYLFAPAFFWEDVVSMLVIALHTAYLFALVFQTLDPYSLMTVALAAYAAYVINAAQFVLKLRMARLQSNGGSDNGQMNELSPAE